MRSSNTSHRVIDSLLYPAFLGNMSYVALEKLFNIPGSYTKQSAALAAALLLHYVMDWAYTVNNATKERYYHGKFLADLVIVVCLYVAVRLSLEDDIVLFKDAWPPVKQPAFWLVVTKVAAVVWETIRARSAGGRWTRTKKLAVGVDAFAGVVYLVFLILTLAKFDSRTWLAAAVFVDAVLYPIHDFMFGGDMGNTRE